MILNMVMQLVSPKFQEFISSSGQWFWLAVWGSLEAVSYTHLDVYKRQYYMYVFLCV